MLWFIESECSGPYSMWVKENRAFKFRPHIKLCVGHHFSVLLWTFGISDECTWHGATDSYEKLFPKFGSVNSFKTSEKHVKCSVSNWPNLFDLQHFSRSWNSKCLHDKRKKHVHVSYCADVLLSTLLLKSEVADRKAEAGCVDKNTHNQRLHLILSFWQVTYLASNIQNNSLGYTP